MSYILEALKKAQAERQLGSAPTIHAMSVGAAEPEQRGQRRRPAWIALSAAALAVVLAALAWRGLAPAVKPAAQAPVVQLPAAPRPVTPAPAPEMASPAPPLAVVAPTSPAPAKKPAPAEAPAIAEEEKVQALRDLPEPIQRVVPQVVFGGYMYSNNPADRLLLIDKTLRREGDEVAPGLVLEKLLPKAAVMNYKGYRYRVPY